MKIELYAGGVSSCWSGNCPAIYRTDKGTFLVQGKKVTEADASNLEFGSDEAAVEIPEHVALELSTRLGR